MDSTEILLLGFCAEPSLSALKRAAVLWAFSVYSLN